MSKRKEIDFRTHRAPEHASPHPHGIIATAFDATDIKARVFRISITARDWPDAKDRAASMLSTHYGLTLWDWCSWPITQAQFQNTDTLEEITP